MKILHNKVITVILFVVLLLVVILMGVTFAYFQLSKENTDVIKGNYAKIDLSLSVSKVVDAGVLIPMDDGLLENAINSTHNCVDNSGYGVCHIYKIVVTNKGDSVTGISSTLAFNLTNINNLKWQEISSQTSIGTITGATNGINATSAISDAIVWRTNDKLKAGETKNYYIAIWISNLNESQNIEDYGNYSGIVTFSTASGEVSSTFRPTSAID